ncbi:MAG: hypothetical protein JWN43_2769 [Gammaproteobacteria bacterium]|nr:hypothetical protein [Gammaproteobacteria bacterium]
MEYDHFKKPSIDDSPDGEDRIRDFLSRHGGPGPSPPREQKIDSVRGWSEVYAADGYTLRCDWTRLGTREEMAFSELPPGVNS